MKKQIFIFNRIIPFKRFFAMNFFTLIFVRKEYKQRFFDVDGQPNTYTSRKMANHESIHTEQMKELLFIGFYIWYLLEWILRVLNPSPGAYKNICFEREAADHAAEFDYLSKRKRFAWMSYYKKGKS